MVKRQDIVCLSCGKPLAAPTAFCPFCGKASGANVSKPADLKAPDVVAAPVEQVVPQEVQLPPPSVPEPLPEPDAKPEPEPKPEPELKPEPVSETKPEPTPEPERVVVSEEKTTVIPVKPTGRWKWVVAGAVVAAVAGFWIWNGRDSVTVTAVPDHWTAVDASRFPAGTKLVFYSKGAFRVRASAMAPVLVDGNGGDVALNDLRLQGLEIRSASGESQDVTIRKASND